MLESIKLILLLVASGFVFVLAPDVLDEVPQANGSVTTAVPKLNVTDMAPDETSTIWHKKWVSQMFDEAKSKFTVHPNASAACKRDYRIFQQHADNQTIWAVRMLESSEWPAVGIFSGSLLHMGDYTECLKSEAPRFRGQYCLVNAIFRYNLAAGAASHYGWNDWPDEKASAWAVMNEYELNRLRLSRQSLTWAMCIPSSCRVHDLQMSVLKVLRPIMRANKVFGMVSVDPSGCQVQGRRHYPQSYYVVRSVLVCLMMLVASATVYDVLFLTGRSGLNDKFDNSSLVKMLKCFSAKRNCELLAWSSGNTILILYLIKTIFIMIVIFGHENMLSGMFPKTQTEEMELEFSVPWSIESLFNTVLGGFFMVSGFLTFYFSYRRRTSILQLILSIVFRWLRLVPVMSLMILVYTFVLPHMGEGPVWKYSMNEQVFYCEKNWWTNVLTINNFVNNKELCMPHSWYITVDFQVSVVGNVLLYILGLHEQVGILAIGITFISANVISFLKIYQNRVYGVPLYFTGLFGQPNNLKFMTKVYIMPYNRIGPYLLGCAAALLTRRLQERKYEFSSLQKVFLLVPSFVIGFGAQLYTFVLYVVGRPYDPLENAIFGILHQVLFAIPIALLVCIYIVSGLGIFNKLLEFKLYLPLGRLVYCSYLISIPIQLYHFSFTKRARTGMNRTDVYWRAVTDFVYSVIFAFFFFLISEGPIDGMLKILRNIIIKKLIGDRRASRQGDTKNPADIVCKINNTGTAKVSKLMRPLRRADVLSRLIPLR